MSPIQLSHIQAYITRKFKDVIDLSDVRTDAERDASLLTRGLAATALQLAAGISIAESAAAITDGFDDGGIDAIYHDPGKKRVFFVQSKWSKGGNKTISQGDILKFINGLKSIIRYDFSSFNDKIKNRTSEIASFLDEAKYTAKIILAHASNDHLSDHVLKDISTFINEVNDSSDLFSFDEINQRKLHKFIQLDGVQNVDFDVDLYDFGLSVEGRKIFYGKVSAAAVAAWKEENSSLIFDKNIRSFLGDTAINTSIVESLCSDPDGFVMMNNGITIICNQINDTARGAGARNHRRLICTGAQIVNGAQTVGACHKARYTDGADISSAFVMAKIIEVGDDEKLGGLITRSTNTQNKIERKDFVSLDELQKNLKISFALIGIDYLIKSGETNTSKTDFLSLEDATYALIIQKQDIDLASLAKREIGKIWEKLDGKNYTSLFNSRINASNLWKLVKLHRRIDTETTAFSDLYGGRGKGYAIHGNIFIALQIYKRLDFSDYFTEFHDDVKLTSNIRKITHTVFASIYHVAERDYEGSYLAHLFRNAGKCHDISAKLDEPITKLMPYADNLTMAIAAQTLAS